MISMDACAGGETARSHPITVSDLMYKRNQESYQINHLPFRLPGRRSLLGLICCREMGDFITDLNDREKEQCWRYHYIGR